MQPHLRTIAGALALAALLPSTALAQNLADEVTSGTFAPSTVPVTVGSNGPNDPVHIIKSNDDALQARMYDVIPPNMLVNYDFNQTMLLLAVDGRTSGPGSVTIDVVKKNLLSTSWIPLEYLEVTVTRYVNTGVGLPAAIRPYQLVKMPKSNLLIIPRTVTKTSGTMPPPPVLPAFSEISRRLVTQPAINWTGPGGMPNPPRHTNQIEVKADGQVTISRWSSPGLTGIPPLVGTATQAELDKLSDAVRAANFSGIPIDLGSGLPQFTFRVLGMPTGDRKIQGVRGQEGQYKARLDRVHGVLDAIAARLQGTTPPTGLGFTEINRYSKDQKVAINWTGPGGMPNPPMDYEDIRIRANGEVKFQRWSSALSAGNTPVTGTATQAELQTLGRAIRDAKFNQIPIDLGSGLPQFTFKVLGIAGGDRKIQGVRGQEGQYKARLDAVHAAIDAIRDRLDGQTPPAGLGFTEINRSTKEQRVAINWTGPGGMPNPPEHYEDIRIRANGEVKFSEWTNQAGVAGTGATGTATPAELKTLAKAIRDARFHSIPKDLGSGLPQFTFMVLGLPAGDRKIQGVRGSEGQFKARLDAVHAAIDAIRNRVAQQQPNGTTFDSLSLNVRSGLIGGQNKTISINKSGDVTVSARMPGGPNFHPARGTASDADMAELRRLIQAAKLSTIPSQLIVPMPMHLPSRPFTLGVRSTQQANDNKISGQYGYYGQYDARLRPLIAQIEAIGKKVTNPPSTEPFDLVSRTQTFPLKRRQESLLVDADGNATLKTGGIPPMLEPALRTITGRLTAAEKRDLGAAVRKADMSTLPAKLPTPIHIVAGDTFSLKVSAYGSEDEGSTSGEIGYYGVHAAKLSDLMKVLDGITTRLKLQTPPKLYMEITQSTRVPSEIAAGEQLEIKVEGIRPSTASLVDIETRLKSIETMPPTWELTVNAVGKHNVNVGDAAIIRPFSKTIRVDVPGDVTVVFNTEFNNGSARFEREVKVLKADRAQGLVESKRIGNKTAVWLVDGSKRVRVMPTSFARTLLKFEGIEATVVVEGKMRSSQTIRAKTLVSPTRQDISGTVSVAQDGTVMIGSSWWGPGPITPWPPIGPVLPTPMPPVVPFDNGPSDLTIAPFRQYVALGDAKRVVAAAKGLRVTADAWVFENNRRPPKPTKALIVGVRGTVLEDSNLTRRGRKVNEVKQHQQVLVTKLNRRGTHAVVEPKTGRSGYMKLDKLELGDRLFHILPAGGNTSGLVGSVNGASSND